MNDKLPISCFVITKNEEDRLAATLMSVRSLVDEIVVVDSGSTDNTEQIAQDHGANFIFNEWAGFGPQKRFGEDQCKNDWVLNLDADEVLSEAMVVEIRDTFANSSNPPHNFFRMRIKTVYPHQTKPRLWADYHNYVRLYRKSVVRFSESETLDSVVENGADGGQLSADVLHYSVRSLDHLIEKYNSYTTLQAETRNLRQTSKLIARLFVEFPINFFKYYILRRNFTGGTYGLTISVTAAFFRFIRIAKMLEQKGNGGPRKQ